ncbi:MAG: YdeI/OmpD-associated family protein [Alphaproteobacteria bacterium]|nr:YdeI/OmpD-associated family protein [Alphaproteobacteria bacterium]
MNPKVTAALAKEKAWPEEFAALREICLASGLAEDLKWGKACYSLNGANVVLIHGFKAYCALLFMKGALLDNRQGLLVQQTENVQSARQIRFTGLGEIRQLAPRLKAIISEAIAIEKSGAKVQFKTAAEFAVPEEFQAKLQKSATLKKAFAALTPGRQKQYLLFFAGAKQAATRAARVEKFAPHILAGKGMDDEGPASR